MSWFQALAHFGDHESAETEEFFLGLLRQTVVAKMEMLVATAYVLDNYEHTKRAQAISEELAAFFGGKEDLFEKYQSTLVATVLRLLVQETTPRPVPPARVLKLADHAASWLPYVDARDRASILRGISTFLDVVAAPQLARWNRDDFVARYPTDALRALDVTGTPFGLALGKM